MVPLLLVLLEEQQFLMSLIVFIAAGITDGLDGLIAKKFNARTKLGAILDPLADKALLVSSYVMLSLMGLIPYWLMVVVVFRDVVIVAGYLIMVLFFGSISMRPLRVSKLNTVMQITYIIIVLTGLAYELGLETVVWAASLVVLATSLSSGIAYVYIWSIRATNSAENDDQSSTGKQPE